MSRITVKTLADALGVSASTVSNAYNHPDQLSADLRAKILAKAEELGYPGPDAAGRALRSGRAEAVGVLLGEQLSYAFSDPYAIGFLTGLSEVVEQRQISIVLMPLAFSADELDVTAVRQAAIDGITTLGLPAEHRALQVARARGVRVVGSDRDADPNSTWVAIDDLDAGRLVGAHLAELGHRRVAIVVETNRPAGGQARPVSDDEVGLVDYGLRLRGIRETLSGPLEVVSGGHNAVASGRTAAEWLLAQPEPPTAIIALSDVLALGVLEAAHALGVAIPTQLSVVGFDDIAAAADADLTTVRQPIRDRGRRVGELLLDPDLEPRQVLLPIELLIRGSTGPVPR